MTHYDLVVVGAGSGNTILTEDLIQAGGAGRRVAMVEHGPFGGTCVNRGCIPSKMFVHPADVLRQAVRGPALGVGTSGGVVDWKALQARVLDRIDGIAQGGLDYRQGQDGVDVLTGTGRFTGPMAMAVDLAAGGSLELTADQIVLAAGSRPIVPDIEGLHAVEHHTSDTVMRIPELPLRMGVLGGGYVGCELAHVFSSYGVEVVQVDQADTLLTNQDAEVARFVTESVSRRWDVRLGVELERVEPHGGSAVLHLSDGSSADVDMVLVAVGRRPNSDLLDCAAGGVDVDDAGRVVVDAYQRTTADGVWALGDLSSAVPLKHVANHEADVVRHNLLHPDDPRRADHDAIPNAVFTRPQVGAVGLTEQQARDQGIDLVVGRKDYADVAFGWSMQGDDDGTEELGFVKVLAEKGTGRLVGAHVVGEQASVLVQSFVTAMALGIPAGDFARRQYWIHPALTEVVENALLDAAG